MTDTITTAANLHKGDHVRLSDGREAVVRDWPVESRTGKSVKVHLSVGQHEVYRVFRVGTEVEVLTSRQEIEAAHTEALAVEQKALEPFGHASIRVGALNDPTRYRVEIVDTAPGNGNLGVRFADGELNVFPIEDVILDSEHEKALEMNARFDALMQLSELGLTLAFNRSQQHLADIDSRDCDDVWVPQFERHQARAEAWLIAVVDDKRDKIASVVEVLRERFEFDWAERLTVLLDGDAEKAQHFGTFVRR